MNRRAVWRVAGAALVATTGVSIVSAAAGSVATIPVYGTYTPQNTALTRVPYVSDLQQTTAEVTWATTTASGKTPGYLAWGPAGNCTKYSVAVKTSLPSFYSIKGGTSSTSWAYSVNSTAEEQSSVQMSGLAAHTTYCYEPETSNKIDLLGTSQSQSFTTLDGTSLPSTGLTFDVMGDTGETTGADESASGVNEDQAAIDTEIGNSGAKFLVTTGDMAYPDGSNVNYGDLQQTGSETSDIFGPSYWPNTGGIPTYSTAGNHGQSITELRTWPEEVTAAAGSTPGTYAYDAYDDPTNDIDMDSPDQWYAVQDGPVRLYVLDGAWEDSQSGPTGTGNATGALCTHEPENCEGYQADDSEHWQTNSPEMKWLKADLAAHPGGIKMAFFHYPLQSLSITQPSDVYEQRDLEPLLAANGVSIAFNGHAHTYQRFSIPTSTSTQITNYVTGGGGGTLSPVETTGDAAYTICKQAMAVESVYALGWSPGGTPGKQGKACGQTATTPTAAAQVYNFLKVNVTGNQITVDPVNALGAVFDAQSYTVNANGTTTLNTSGSTSPTTTTTSTTTTTTTTTQPTHSPIAEVQAVSAASGTLPISATRLGDTLVLESSLDTGATNGITGVTDSSGDPVQKWKQLDSYDVAGHDSYGAIWYLADAPADITSVTVASKTTALSVAVQEFSGLGTAPTVVDQVTGTPASPTSNTVSATVTGSGLAVGFAAGHGNSQTITPTGTGFTNQADTASTSTTLETGDDLTASGVTTYSASSKAAMYWAAGIAILTPGG